MSKLFWLVLLVPGIAVLLILYLICRYGVEWIIYEIRSRRDLL